MRLEIFIVLFLDSTLMYIKLYDFCLLLFEEQGRLAKQGPIFFVSCLCARSASQRRARGAPFLRVY